MKEIDPKQLAWNDIQLKRLLEAIEKMALLPYPFPEDDIDRDPALILALGQIAGIANKTLNGMMKE